MGNAAAGLIDTAQISRLPASLPTLIRYKLEAVSSHKIVAV